MLNDKNTISQIRNVSNSIRQMAYSTNKCQVKKKEGGGRRVRLLQIKRSLGMLYAFLEKKPQKTFLRHLGEN